MAPQSNSPAEPDSPARPRRFSVLVLRLGILGAFLAALSSSVVSFALFGCYCPRTLEMQEFPDEKTPPTETKDSPPSPLR